MSNEIQQINELIKQKRIAEADAVCVRFTQTHPNQVDGWILRARLNQMKGDDKGMLECATKAASIAPDNLIALLQVAEGNLHLQNNTQANKNLADLEKKSENDPRILQHVAELFTYAGNHESAMRCYKQAHSIIGDVPELLYNTANSAIALGDAVEAERLLDLVIAKNPHDYDAYYNRATYRKQTAENNHTDQIENLISSGIKNAAGLVQLEYALAKEYEDLGISKKSFMHLKNGADCRRKMLSYDVRSDVDTIDEIERAMGADFLKDCVTQVSDAGPVFILGMPRSGTTLVDRIISSHSKVESLGEINDFSSAMMSLAPKASSKSDLISKTTEIDFDALGEMYTKTTADKNNRSPFLIDKTPANFLYIGLIAKSLPNAKIIHLRRNPMDSCYAMYKTLFRMGYPFSYNLDDLGQYFAAYYNLMKHWDNALPGRILHVDYEDIIADQEGQSRRLIDHIGLEWEDDCLNFHKNKSASSTASAAQVRKPIYSSSVQKWKKYGSELAPLKEYLEKAGVVT